MSEIENSLTDIGGMSSGARKMSLIEYQVFLNECLAADGSLDFISENTVLVTYPLAPDDYSMWDFGYPVSIAKRGR